MIKRELQRLKDNSLLFMTV